MNDNDSNDGSHLRAQNTATGAQPVASSDDATLEPGCDAETSPLGSDCSGPALGYAQVSRNVDGTNIYELYHWDRTPNRILHVLRRCGDPVTLADLEREAALSADRVIKAIARLEGAGLVAGTRLTPAGVTHLRAMDIYSEAQHRASLYADSLPCVVCNGEGQTYRSFAYYCTSLGGWLPDEVAETCDACAGGGQLDCSAWELVMYERLCREIDDLYEELPDLTLFAALEAMLAAEPAAPSLPR